MPWPARPWLTFGDGKHVAPAEDLIKVSRDGSVPFSTARRRPCLSHGLYADIEFYAICCASTRSGRTGAIGGLLDVAVGIGNGFGMSSVRISAHRHLDSQGEGSHSSLALGVTSLPCVIAESTASSGLCVASAGVAHHVARLRSSMPSCASSVARGTAHRARPACRRQPPSMH